MQVKQFYLFLLKADLIEEQLAFFQYIVFVDLDQALYPPPIVTCIPLFLIQ